jgi:GNAT superfamily N-acetyltransferase
MAEERDIPIPVRVTCLEMTAPPKAFFPVPMNLATALIRAHRIPLPYYRYLYRQVGHRWRWTERLRLSDEDLAERVHDARTNVTVLYVDGAPAGFFELNCRETDVVELEYFGLMQHALGHGLGKWFLLQALHAAWSGMPNRVIVQTSTLDHPRALALYQRVGFTPYGTREEELLPLSDAELLALAHRDVAVEVG